MTPTTCPDCRCTFTPPTDRDRDGCFCPRCLRRQRRARWLGRAKRAIADAWFNLWHPGWAVA